MEIPISKEWLEQLHSVLKIIYQNTEDPIGSAIPLVKDYNDTLLNVCVDRHNAKMYGKVIYPHVLQKAAVLMHSIIVFHPFVDGNKRTALIAVDFYLHWNGYDFEIPYEADYFTISVAKGEQNLNAILNWLVSNSKRTVASVIRHWCCEQGIDLYSLTGLIGRKDSIYVPFHAVKFFRYKIQKAQQKRTEAKKSINPDK